MADFNLLGPGFVLVQKCSGLVKLLFLLRDWLLSWQKGLVAW